MINIYCLRIIPMILLLAMLSTAAAQEGGDDPPGMNPIPMLPLTPIDTTENALADTTDEAPDDSVATVQEDSLDESSPLGRTDTADTVEGDLPADTTAALPLTDSTAEAALPDTSAEESPDNGESPETLENSADGGNFPPRDTERGETPVEEEANPLGRSTPPDSLDNGEAVSQHSPESERNGGGGAPSEGSGADPTRPPAGTTATRDEDSDAGSEETPPWTRTERSPMQGLRPVGEEDAEGLAPLAERPLEYFEEDESSIEPRFEITPWVGATFFREGGQPWAGLRFAEIAFWPTEKARLWLQYDNGLSFDNLRVARSTETTPALYAGGFLNYEENHTTRAEIGIRTLPGNISQILVRTEQVYAFSDGHSLKGGLWLGPRSDGKNEWILHAGGGVPVSSSIRLDPTFFYSRSGDPGQKEWRILVSGEYTMMNGLRIAGGVAGGVQELGNGWKQGVAEEFVKVSARIEDFYQLHALFKNETVGPRRGITVVAAGFTWGFGGR